ncbi:DNA-3-methyladenine glycosylase I, partial [Litorivivens sp.]
LPKAKTARQLANVGDDRYLAEMAACIFRAGFVWRVVQNKWDGFEEVFNGFLPIWVASRSPEQLEEMASDTRIIRNLNKVKAVQDNALLVLDLQREYGSVGKFLGQWPQDDVIGLWQYLKKHGSRLGGNSGQYFLRFTGKDTFILSRDVCAALKLNGVIDRDNPTAQRDLRKIQDAFNAMHAESGWQLCQLSRMLAMSIG